ncbi:hypothetical protein MMMDOFMJ_1599 [Methylobacterium gnaphalii]|nr:hypothetical protein MMMDOFMJ_1599 [Methylobacterium gnaphalii]
MQTELFGCRLSRSVLRQPIGCRLSVRDTCLVDQLPHHDIDNRETPTRLRDADPRIAGDVAITRNSRQEAVALGAIRRLCREPRRHADHLVQRVAETLLRRAVGVDETRIGIGVVSQEREWGLLVGPSCIRPLRQQWPADEALIAAGQEREEVGVFRQVRDDGLLGSASATCA